MKIFASFAVAVFLIGIETTAVSADVDLAKLAAATPLCPNTEASASVPIGAKEIRGAYQDALVLNQVTHLASTGAGGELTRVSTLTRQEYPKLFSALEQDGLRIPANILTLSVSQWPNKSLVILWNGVVPLAGQEYSMQNSKLQVRSGMMTATGIFDCATYEAAGNVLAQVLISTKYKIDAGDDVSVRATVAQTKEKE